MKLIVKRDKELLNFIYTTINSYRSFPHERGKEMRFLIHPTMYYFILKTFPAEYPGIIQIDEKGRLKLFNHHVIRGLELEEDEIYLFE